MTDTERFVDNSRGAVISDDGEYRYQLRRYWDVRKPIVAFLMLNPSTADATKDDPTVRRCIGFAKDWGYGTLLVGNLFAARTPDPDLLTEFDDPVGPVNDAWLEKITGKADLVVAAWGANGGLQDRASEVVEMLEADLHAIGTTKDGYPVHPLYQPSDAESTPWSERFLHADIDQDGGGWPR